MTQRKLKLLIVNDDGIQAPGIYHLWKSLKDHADLSIVAPLVEQSGKGVGITIGTSLRIDVVEWENNTQAWSVNGTPADCVKMALSVILQEAPDLIVSGINRGTNAGRNVLYSGTIGGIIEGTLRGIPGIAFSAYDMEDTSYSYIEPYIPGIVKYVLRHPLPKGTLLNVNFPLFDCAQTGVKAHVKGLKLARQGKQYIVEDPNPHEESANHFWIGAKFHEFEEDTNSDIYWLKKGYMTSVPLHVDELTDHSYITEKQDVFESYFSAWSL